MELTKKEMILAILTFETQRDVEEAIDKNDRVFGHLYDEIMINLITLLL